MDPIEKYKKNNGETAYRFQVYTGINPLTGRKSNTKKQGFKTKREANIALQRIKNQVVQGTYFNTNKQSLTFEELYVKWRNSYKNGVNPSTLLKCDQLFENRLLPAFGEYLISKLDSDIIQDQINEWKNFVSCRKWINHMSRVMQLAVKLQYITVNPCDFVTIPKIQNNKKKKEFYETDELRQYMQALDDWNDLQGRAMIRLLAFTGIRVGEASALVWSDIDIENKTLNINKAISRKKDKKTGNSMQFLKDPKNFPSIRYTSIDEETINYLMEWKKYNSSDNIFVNSKGKWIDNSNVRRWQLQVTKLAGLEFIPVHKIRHTHATLLFEAGATPKEVQQRLGHGKIDTTMDIYTHTTRYSRDQFAETFSKHVKKMTWDSKKDSKEL